MKLLEKISDNIFRITDRFFQGNRLVEHCPIPPNVASNGQYVVWELNQGVEDILIKDIRGSINFFIPAFIRKPLEQICRKASLYFLVDAVIEDETIDPELNKASRLNFILPSSEKQNIFITRAKNDLNRNILNLQDWLKIRLQKNRHYFRHPRHTKPYYLLGNFTPAFNESNLDGLNYISNEADKTNFMHTFIFHKRN